MKNRRDFLKSSLLVAGGLAIGQSGGASAGSSAGGYPANVIFTADNSGIWAKKVGSHAPLVSREANKISLFTKHGMSDEHFIVRHTLVSSDGQMIGAKTFMPSDEEARSEYELPEGYSGKLYATSFCNKHDFWVSEFTV